MRTDLAAEILAVRDVVATAVTDSFLEHHPSWIERYGDRARVRGEEDARHHIDFLAASLEIGNDESFADYTRWCRGVLESRGIAGSYLAENFETIGRELQTRISPEGAALAGLALATGLAVLAGPAEQELPPDETPLTLVRRLYTDAAISGRRKDALALVRESLASGSTLLDIYVEIFQEALYEVGRRWATTGLSVAEEHMATATTQFILSVLYEEASTAATPRGNAVVTGVRDELHQVGANIVADALESDGWDVQFMGAYVPHDGILAAIDEHQPELVGISATIVSHVGSVRDLISDIRAHEKQRTRILVGGGAFRSHPDLWREVGADAYAADVRSAVEIARV
ncbi:MAG: cobalamin B12-binding domain-containing protein [Actinobacteria bacterium]|nr:cobalamin B12-binding domain-containing protein [Actinomycetota bacterium]